MGILVLRSSGVVVTGQLWSVFFSALTNGQDANVTSDVTQDMNPTVQAAEVEVTSTLRFQTTYDTEVIADNIYVNGGSLLTGVP